jgi:hypothetical protein
MILSTASIHHHNSIASTSKHLNNLVLKLKGGGSLFHTSPKTTKELGGVHEKNGGGNLFRYGGLVDSPIFV